MDILGIDVCTRRFDVALLLGERCRPSLFANTETGFAELPSWLGQYRPAPDAPLHACMEATGNWGLDLAEVLHGAGMTVSIVNPFRVKAYGQSELARNKTDKLDAALIARFCRAQRPAAWTPPAGHLRELRELTRRYSGLQAMRVQENQPADVRHGIRDRGGVTGRSFRVAGPADRGDHGGGAGRGRGRSRAEAQPRLDADHTRHRAGHGRDHAGGGAGHRRVHPEATGGLRRAIAAGTQFRIDDPAVGTHQPHGIGAPAQGTSHVLIEQQTTQSAPTGFVQRMVAAGKPPKVILLAIARKLLVFAHASVRTQNPFALLTA